MNKEFFRNFDVTGRRKNELPYNGNVDVTGKRKKYPKLSVNFKRTLNTL